MLGKIVPKLFDLVGPEKVFEYCHRCRSESESSTDFLGVQPVAIFVILLSVILMSLLYTCIHS